MTHEKSPDEGRETFRGQLLKIIGTVDPATPNQPESIDQKFEEIQQAGRDFAELMVGGQVSFDTMYDVQETVQEDSATERTKGLFKARSPRTPEVKTSTTTRYPIWIIKPGKDYTGANYTHSYEDRKPWDDRYSHSIRKTPMAFQVACLAVDAGGRIVSLVDHRTDKDYPLRAIPKDKIQDRLLAWNNYPGNPQKNLARPDSFFVDNPTSKDLESSKRAWLQDLARAAKKYKARTSDLRVPYSVEAVVTTY